MRKNPISSSMTHVLTMKRNTGEIVGVGTSVIPYSVVKPYRELVVGDKGIVWWEVIVLEVEGANPDLGDQVDDAVEDGMTWVAMEWEVRKNRRGGEVLHGSVDSGDDIFLLRGESAFGHSWELCIWLRS